MVAIDQSACAARTGLPVPFSCRWSSRMLTRTQTARLLPALSLILAGGSSQARTATTQPSRNSLLTYVLL